MYGSYSRIVLSGSPSLEIVWSWTMLSLLRDWNPCPPGRCDAIVSSKIATWSKNPVIRELQREWAKSGKSVADILAATGLGRSNVYRILVDGAPNAELETANGIATALGLQITVQKLQVQSIPLNPEEQVKKRISSRTTCSRPAGPRSRRAPICACHPG